MIKRDIDMTWESYGLDKYVPAPFHYYLVMLLISLPFVLVISLLCCFIDEDVPTKP